MKTAEEAKKIKDKSISELATELTKTKTKLADLKKNLALGKLKKTSDVKKTKKYIAKIQTAMREKLESELEKEEKANAKKTK